MKQKRSLLKQTNVTIDQFETATLQNQNTFKRVLNSNRKSQFR